MTIPKFMRAVLLTGHGGFEKLGLRDDVPVPDPGAGEVLIRVGAAGVNNTDINTRIGWYSKAVAEATDVGGATGIAGAEDDGWSGAAFRFPRIQGADVCGRVVAVGSGVDQRRIGERILVEPVFRSVDRFDAVYFGSEVDGGFAEYCCVPSRHAHRVESRLTDVQLAGFPCAYSAAENMLSRVALQAGERVLVTGASGGVGSAAVQLEALLALGANRVLVRGTDILAEFGSEYFDAAVDVVGGDQFGAILASLKRGGRYGVAGAISGPVVDLDLRTLYLKDLQLIGCTVFQPEVFANLISYIESGDIKPLVAATFPLSDIVTAQELFLTKTHVGKIVLIP